MTKKSLSPRSIAVLKLASSVPALLKQGRATVAAMENNPMFTKPNPPLDQVTKSLDALETAEIAVTQTRAPGSVEARDAAKTIVVSDFHLLRAYVQSVADADRANSDKIITSATMHVKLSPARKKSDLAAKAGRSRARC